MTLFSVEYATGAWGFMLGFLGIVRGSAYTPFRTVRTFKGNVEG